MSNIFIKDNTNTEMINMYSILSCLSQNKGKLEIVFQKNENPAYESLLLAFIKIPVYGPIVNILREMLNSDKDEEHPLSKGKLSIDSKNENLHAFVGAVRIKSLNRTADVLYGVLKQMQAMMSSASNISKKDNFGNIKIHNKPIKHKSKKVSTDTPYTFNRGIEND